jgi:hypothetical protein
MRIPQVTGRAAQYDLDLSAEPVRNCPRAWLRTIAEFPDGKFHWGCGQAWGTYAETVSLCARLVWRGTLTVEGEGGRFKDKRVWTITQAGRKALDV